MFLSKSLTKAQTQYSATELECLAVHWALHDQLSHILDGAEFELQTDHKALKALFLFSTLNPRLQTWAIDLEPFRPHMKVTYLPGETNKCADALSRYPRENAQAAPAASGELDTYHIATSEFETCESTAGDDIFNLFFPLAKTADDILTTSAMAVITDATLPSPFLEWIRLAQQAAKLTNDQYTTIGSDNLFRHRPTNTIIIPTQDRELINNILWEFHDAPSGAHLGRDKLMAMLKRRFYWESMRDDVRQYTATCVSCQQHKSPNRPRIGFLQSLQILPRPFHTVSIDFITGFPESSLLYHEKFDAIMVIVDLFTKYTTFTPLRQKASAEQVTWLFYANIVVHWGLPHKIVSDRDVRFTSDFWTHLWKLFGTRLAFSAPYHPQTDGQTERANRTLEEMLRHFCSKDQTTWAKWLPLLQLVYNASKHAGTTFSPQFLFYGFHADLPTDLVLPPGVPETHGVRPLYYHTQELNCIRELARRAIQHAQERMAHQHNRHRQNDAFRESDLVLVDSHAFGLRKETGTVPKLNPRFLGPFKVLEVISSHAYRLDLPTEWRVHPVVSVEYLRRFHQSDPAQFPQREIVQPEVGPQPDDRQYEVEKILDRKRITRREKEKRLFPINDTWKFLVQWRDKPDQPLWIGESVLREGASKLADKYIETHMRDATMATQRVRFNFSQNNLNNESTPSEHNTSQATNVSDSTNIPQVVQPPRHKRRPRASPASKLIARPALIPPSIQQMAQRPCVQPLPFAVIVPDDTDEWIVLEPEPSPIQPEPVSLPEVSDPLSAPRIVPIPSGTPSLEESRSLRPARQRLKPKRYRVNCLIPTVNLAWSPTCHFQPAN